MEDYKIEFEIKFEALRRARLWNDILRRINLLLAIIIGLSGGWAILVIIGSIRAIFG